MATGQRLDYPFAILQQNIIDWMAVPGMFHLSVLPLHDCRACDLQDPSEIFKIHHIFPHDSQSFDNSYQIVPSR